MRNVLIQADPTLTVPMQVAFALPGTAEIVTLAVANRIFNEHSADSTRWQKG